MCKAVLICPEHHVENVSRDFEEYAAQARLSHASANANANANANDNAKPKNASA